MPLWDKANTTVNDWTLRFTVGDDHRWDRQLLPYDVLATRAHVWGLTQIGVLTEAERASVDDGLDALLEAFEAGRVTVEPQDEDCHTVIEHFLTTRLGDVGRKIHAGRSRNDQVLAALRLYLQDALAALGGQVVDVSRALIDVAERHDDVLMPGYTHLQRAMPSTVALWALGYAETAAADLETLRHARDTVNVSPLGSAAGYGVPHLDLPREAVAERLGFRAVQTHATAVQLSRGKHELTVAHACVQCAATANRLASDLSLFATSEFGFVEIPPEHCTGSSIMPQKQNPDVVELVRAHYHRVVSEMQSLATLPANLPGGYHRDLQLTKAAVMRAVQTTGDVLTALARVVEGLRFRPEQTEPAVTPDMLATEQALAHVTDGVPFRSAYQSVATDVPDAVDAADVLGAYATTGTPGHERADVVASMLDAHREWTH